MAVPTDNFGAGLYYIIDQGQLGINDFEYVLLDNGTQRASKVFTVTAGVGVNGEGLVFPSTTIQSVSGDFNELRISIRNGGLPGGLYLEVGVWSFATQNSGGNNVQISSPDISFESGKRGVRRYVQDDGLQTTGTSHFYRILTGSTVRDTITMGATAFSVQNRERVERTANETFENTGSTLHTIDVAEIQTQRGGGTAETVSSGPIGPYEWGPGATITIENSTIYFTDNDKT